MAYRTKKELKDRKIIKIKEISQELKDLYKELKECEQAERILEIHKRGQELQNVHTSLINEMIMLSI